MNLNSWFRRCINNLVSIAITATSVMLFVPRDGCCADGTIESMAKDIVAEMDARNFESIPEKFKELGRFFEMCHDPTTEIRRFFQAFVDEANARYGLSLTVSQTCQLLKDGLLMKIPLESQEPMLRLLELLCTEPLGQETIPQELQKDEKSEP